MAPAEPYRSTGTSVYIAECSSSAGTPTASRELLRVMTPLPSRPERVTMAAAHRCEPRNLPTAAPTGAPLLNGAARKHHMQMPPPSTGATPRTTHTHTCPQRFQAKVNNDNYLRPCLSEYPCQRSRLYMPCRIRATVPNTRKRRPPKSRDPSRQYPTRRTEYRNEKYEIKEETYSVSTVQSFNPPIISRFPGRKKRKEKSKKSGRESLRQVVISL